MELALVELVLDELRPLVLWVASGLFSLELAAHSPSAPVLVAQALEGSQVVLGEGRARFWSELGLGLGNSPTTAKSSHLGARLGLEQKQLQLQIKNN